MQSVCAPIDLEDTPSETQPAVNVDVKGGPKFKNPINTEHVDMDTPIFESSKKSEPTEPRMFQGVRKPTYEELQAEQ